MIQRKRSSSCPNESEFFFSLVLTNEEVPLRIQIRLVGQTAPHYVVTVVVTGFQARHVAAVWTVQHLGQGFDTRWSYVHLENNYYYLSGLSVD